MIPRIPGLALVACLSLAACGGGDESSSSSPPESGGPPPAPAPAPSPLPAKSLERNWSFEINVHGPTPWTQLGDVGVLEGPGEILDERQIGGLHVKPQNMPAGAWLTVRGSEEADRYSVSAQTPAHHHEDPTRVVAARSTLEQYQYFVKDEDTASLTFTLTDALIELIDRGPDAAPREPTWEECSTPLRNVTCASIVQGELRLVVRLRNLESETDVFYADSIATLCGYQQHWCQGALTIDAASEVQVWEDDKVFELNLDVEGLGHGDHALMRLAQPLEITIPLDGIAVGERFVLYTQARATAMDDRQNATYAAAFLRDPALGGGAGMELGGVTRIENPGQALPPYEVPAAAVCDLPDPAAGIIQFESGEFAASEKGGAATVYVTRTGGTQGRVSAWFETTDGSGEGDVDYVGVGTHVAFADGQGGRRRIDIPLIDNDESDGERTVELRLMHPRGCATVGDGDNATLFIHDDESPPPAEPTYTVYVRVSGLQGTGLVIEDVRTGANIMPQADGTHALGYAYLEGHEYDVRIHTQPESPAQSCSVGNGTGTVGAADVHGVAVECETVISPGSLDQAFGSGGKVFVDDLGAARAVVVQSTGRIVVLTDSTLAGFHADGSVDTSFGTDGRVPVVFTGLNSERALSLALQPDDKLVVSGRAGVIGSRYDLGIRRYEANGEVDTGFGDGGLTTVNPYADLDPAVGTASSHFAETVIVAGDGRIYVGGTASWFSTTSQSHVDYVAVRLLPDGTPDPAFGDGRGSVIGISANPDLGYAIGVQSDGKVIVAGSADNSAGAGLARFLASGEVDEDYGPDDVGTVFIDQGPQGYLARIADLVMLDDDSLVASTAFVVPHATLGWVTKIALVRLDTDGAPAGADAFVMTPLGPDNDLATRLLRLPDGKFLQSAEVSSPTTVGDFAVLRYNADLTLDASFGTGGFVLVDFYGAREGATCLAVAPDGGIIAAGIGFNGGNSGLMMTRIAP